MSNTFFTSDFHLGHENLLNKMSIPFPTIEEMDDGIIKTYLTQVSKKDTVYFLGDFAWRPWYYRDVLPILPGKIYFIMGNHDEQFAKYIKRCSNIVSIERLKHIKIDKQLITLCHFPLESWLNSSHGTWHLHGHLHGSDHHVCFSRPNKIDVGIQTNNYKLYSFDDVRNKINGS